MADDQEPGMGDSPFCDDVPLDWKGLLRCLRREGTPDRVYFIELLIDNYLAMLDEGRRFCL